MFRIDPQRTYWWPVTIQVPDDSKPGQLKDQSFEVQFKWLPDEEHAAWLKRAGEKKLSDRQAAPDIMLAFRGVAGPDGQALDSTPHNLQLLLAEPSVPSAIVRAYLDSRDKAAEKNSPRPR